MPRAYDVQADCFEGFGESLKVFIEEPATTRCGGTGGQAAW